MKSRGQVFSGEFILAYMVFLVVLTLVIYLWNTNYRAIGMAEGQKEIHYSAVNAAENLVRTSGSPTGWDRFNVESFGLVNMSRRLDPRKLLEFAESMNNSLSDGLCAPAGSTNYECRKYLLVGGYDASFELRFLENDSVVAVDGTAISGGVSSGNSKSLVHVERSAILLDDIVVLNLEVWE